MTENATRHGVADQQAYFDAVDEYVRRVWGEDIHVGIFESPHESLGAAMQRTNQRVSQGVGLTADHVVLEVACGYGSTARYLASNYGCRVVATNISERELEHGRALTAAAGLADKVSFEWADFHELPFGDGEFDYFWCHDSLLYSEDKPRVIDEAHRVLKAGGRMVFTELLLRRHTPEPERVRIREGIGTPDMWDAPDYAGALEAKGFRIHRLEDWSPNVVPTFEAVYVSLTEARADLEKTIPAEFLAKTFTRIGTWAEAARSGHIGWIYVVAEM